MYVRSRYHNLIARLLHGCGLQLVMVHIAAPGGAPIHPYATLLLRDPSHGRYAACQLDVCRRLVLSPNYRDGDTLLSSMLTRRGIRAVLDWADRECAVSRFRVLTQHAGHGLSNIRGSGRLLRVPPLTLPPPLAQ